MAQAQHERRLRQGLGPAQMRIPLLAGRLHARASVEQDKLAERIRAEQAAMESRGATDGERKTITALFADLKGSTALIEGLDPEDARAIIDPALQLMMDAVHRYDGYVAPQLGSGQAISVSVVIQSCGWVSRCLAGRSGSSAASG